MNVPALNAEQVEAIMVEIMALWNERVQGQAGLVCFAVAPALAPRVLSAANMPVESVQRLVTVLAEGFREGGNLEKVFGGES